MKEIFHQLKNGILMGIGFVLILIFSGITYGVYTALTDVNPGESFTAAMWNTMIDNQEDFHTRLNNIPDYSSLEQNNGNIGIGTTTAAYPLTVSGSMLAGTYLRDFGSNDGVQNVHQFINVVNNYTHASATSLCASGDRAIFTPFGYLGRTGDQVCADDARGYNSCVTQKYVYSTVGGSFAAWSGGDRGCAQTTDAKWPWMRTPDGPNSYSPEWSMRTWVVCCSN